MLVLNNRIIKVELSTGDFMNFLARLTETGKMNDQSKLKYHLCVVEDAINMLNQDVLESGVPHVYNINGVMYTRENVISVLGSFSKLVYPSVISFDGTNDFEVRNLRTKDPDFNIEYDKLDPAKLEASVRAIYAHYGRRDAYHHVEFVDVAKVTDMNIMDDKASVCIKSTGLPISIDGLDVSKLYKEEYLRENPYVTMRLVYEDVAKLSAE